MTNTKKILITTESHEIFIIWANGKSIVSDVVPDCVTETEISTTGLIVSLSQDNKDGDDDEKL